MTISRSPIRWQHRHGRPHIGANGVSWPPWKNVRKIKKRKHAKRTVFYVYGIFVRTALCWPNIIYWDILQNAPFRSQIFFVSGGKDALTPLTKILRTFVSTGGGVCGLWLPCFDRRFVADPRGCQGVQTPALLFRCHFLKEHILKTPRCGF